MKINLEELRSRSVYINEQKHPTLGLLIWNYTQKCQFDNAWDSYTLMCRGLITDLEGNILARPFEKFFNYSENKIMLPTTAPHVFAKIDGSLGILYFDNDTPLIATRGSFSSEQALVATSMLSKKQLKKTDFLEGYTYLFEIIYPENRIVVNYYDKEELVLLAVKHTDSGVEDLELFFSEALRLGFNVPASYDLTLTQILASTTKKFDNSEGFVLFWPQEDVRVKIKLDEYIRLHRVLTDCTTTRVWELLKESGNEASFLEDVPDEFHKWFTDTKTDLLNEYLRILSMCKDIAAETSVFFSRKEKALFLLDTVQDSTLRSIVFGLLDSKDVDTLIWNYIRPKNSKAFSQ